RAGQGGAGAGDRQAHRRDRLGRTPAHARRDARLRSRRAGEMGADPQADRRDALTGTFRLHASLRGIIGMRYSVSIDVPRLDDGLAFYRDALGLPEIARPVPIYVILQCETSQMGLMENPAGSIPATGSDDVRRYERHWTPVHIDFQVDDFEAFL